MRILLVDDQDDIRDIYEIFLTSYFKCDIIQANSVVSAATEILKNTKNIDIVISDYHMPEGNGGVLYTYVKKYLPETPFILFSSNIGIIDTDIVFKNFFKDNPYNSVISKPCAADEFAYIVGNIYQESNSCVLKRIYPRKHERYNMVVDASIKFFASEQIKYTKVMNLSNGGMFVRLDDQFPPKNSFVEYNLLSGNLNQPHGRGIIRWVRDKKANHLLTGCGVEFLQ